MSGPIRRRAVALAAATAAGASLALLPPATAAPAKSYDAPFTVGPAGGDQWSYHSAGTDGTVTVARVYPVPGLINCTKGGPYAKLLVPFRASRPVRKVVVSYDSAAVDNFTFAMVSLRDRRGHWYGTTTDRGLVAGSGRITLVPDRPQGRLPRAMVVEFGLQQSSACPNADAGTIHFTRVEISS